MILGKSFLLSGIHEVQGHTQIVKGRVGGETLWTLILILIRSAVLLSVSNIGHWTYFILY
jgi:hypothetical protein